MAARPIRRTLLVLALAASLAFAGSAIAGGGYGPWAGKYLGAGESASAESSLFTLTFRLSRKGKVSKLIVRRLAVSCDGLDYEFRKTAFRGRYRLNRNEAFKAKRSFRTPIGRFRVRVRGQLADLGARFRGLVAVKTPGSRNCGPHSRWKAHT